jgi:uncharacterized protein YjbJ (UPF0337 family)
LEIDQKEILSMGVPNRREIRGKINKAKGVAKQKLGRAVGNRRLEREGSANRTKGSIQETVGKATRKAGDAVKSLGKTIRKR